ncbi:MAG TPA: DNA repair protein RecO [Chloroflexia bacterium]|nr:DNA repair protein RecO [Chloroflexia bacterium]
MTTPLHERLYRTEAIVLRRSEIGEADYILTLFTPHLGKIRVVAKGVRKPTSHMGGHVELFSRSRMQLATARNLDIVTQCEVLDAHRPIGEELDRIAYAFYLVELIDRLTPDEQENYAVYKLLADGLSHLDTAGTPELLQHWYEIQLLGLLGYRPELIQCVQCRTPLEPVVNAWSPAQGGVLCPACKRASVARDLSLDAFKMLRLMQRSPWADVARMWDKAGGLDKPHVLSEMDTAMNTYVTYVLEREPRSARFLKVAEQVPDYAAPDRPA